MLGTVFHMDAWCLSVVHACYVCGLTFDVAMSCLLFILSDQPIFDSYAPMYPFISKDQAPSLEG